MTTHAHLPKRFTKRLKVVRKTTEHNQSPSSQKAAQPVTLDPTQLSPATLIHLQRTIGNYAVQRMLNQPQPGVIQMPPVDTDHFNPTTMEAGETIQRSIEPLEGKSSGWFGTGRRDKINALVKAYNILEKKVSSKPSAAGYKSLVPDIQKIWLAAHAWQVDVMKSSPEKAEAIGEWMKTQVEPEEDAKVALIGELHNAETLKAAWDGAAYNELYTTPAFTTKSDAGEKWLQTPALAPIYKHFLIQVQHESVTLNAYEDVTHYRENPSRDEALLIYKKYDMGTASQLNITGEGAGGVEAINSVRKQMVALEADPSSDLPANFGAIETSVINVVNEIFSSFRDSTPYKKVTTPPTG